MGTWSAHSFGNDVAADWVGDLLDDGLPVLQRTLGAVADVPAEEYLDAFEAAEALAAAEVVAAAAGRPWAPDETDAPLSSGDDEALEWAQENPEAAELTALALVVVQRVLAESSELRDLWLGDLDATAAAGHEWSIVMDGLRARLSG